MKKYLKVDNKFDLKEHLQYQNDTKKHKKIINLNFLSVSTLNIGVYLITPILLGVIIGYNLDIYLKRKPLFTLLFIILGAVSSFYNLFKLTKE